MHVSKLINAKVSISSISVTHAFPSYLPHAHHMVFQIINALGKGHVSVLCGTELSPGHCKITVEGWLLMTVFSISD